MIVRLFGGRREERRDCRAGIESCTLGQAPTAYPWSPPVRAGVAAQRDTLMHLPSDGRTLDRRWETTEARATMRAHDSDQGYESDLRPKASRMEEPESALAMRAALSGRLDAAGPRGVMGLQRAVGNAGATTLIEEERSPVHDVISSGGAPLPADVREDMEGRFGQDFGDVRVHHDGAAQESAKAVNAQAYTVGSNIVFQRDKYDPASDAGKHMIAHELTHVVQQRSGPVDGSDAGGGVKISDPSDRFERDAVANADRLMSASAPAPVPSHDVQRLRDGDEASSVQRQDAPAEEEEEASAQTFVQRTEDEAEEESA